MGEYTTWQPLVAKWLTQHGYTYIREYTLPDFGRVDFYATHRKDGHILLVEVKARRSSQVITQLAGYGVQIPHAKLAVGVPINVIDDELRRVCAKYGILIIELESELNSTALRECRQQFQVEMFNHSAGAFVRREMRVKGNRVYSAVDIVRDLNKKFTKSTLAYHKTVCGFMSQDDAIVETINAIMCVKWHREIGEYITVDMITEWLDAQLIGNGYNLFEVVRVGEQVKIAQKDLGIDVLTGKRLLPSGDEDIIA